MLRFLADDHLMFIVLVSVERWKDNETGKIKQFVLLIGSIFEGQ